MILDVQKFAQFLTQFRLAISVDPTQFYLDGLLFDGRLSVSGQSGASLSGNYQIDPSSEFSYSRVLADTVIEFARFYHGAKD